ncbi:MAG TPA: dihydroorotase [Nitrospirae bacterium]|nr:dihydroorotase [bacterium BMS3Abin06]HDH10713.1 dihydroorotase [Nitrospirota bacterium]HDL20886.1 dihydroorotase [Nitrospirota bacterium]HDZ03001.1 dihydroorotase [Nitrospirota bacterium]
MRILIKNGRVIDPSQNLDGFHEILIEKNRIKGLYPEGKGPDANKIIDASGCIVIPGLVDMHTHLREPGFEYKETIKSGTMAAVRGGFTTVCCMPNTKPVNDTITVTEFILEKSLREGACTVYPVGAITTAQKSEELTELEALLKTGCIAFSDDGKPVTNSLIMRRALEYSKIFDVPVISHCEDLKLSEDGVMNEGFVSTITGLSGIPKAAEEVMVARDLSLCELTGGKLHIAHVSTEGSVKLIRDAKARGINVTAETCPHYFSLTDESLISYDTNLKVNPPIRTPQDVEAIKQGLKDCTIDVIATDHAPHHIDDKGKEFDAAAFGISGLETAFALSLHLVESGILDLKQLITKMTITPSKIMGISKGTLTVDSDADIAIINTEKTFKVDSSGFLSKGKNSPFNKWQLKGTVEKTIAMGKVYEWA